MSVWWKPGHTEQHRSHSLRTSGLQSLRAPGFLLPVSVLLSEDCARQQPRCPADSFRISKWKDKHRKSVVIATLPSL